MAPRKLPNIIITGTPGVGKTTTSIQLVSLTADTSHQLRVLDINKIVKDEKCHEGYDERLKSWIVDEDKLLDVVESILFPSKPHKEDENENGKDDEEEDTDDTGDGGEGGWIVDWHACDLFPERWVDLVVVLRCADTMVFHDRLEKRGYGEEKMQENIDSEIFGVVAEEAREGFRVEAGVVVVELKSEQVEDVEENCRRVMAWVEKWIEDRHGEKEKEKS